MKEINKKITSFSEHLDKQYGKRGTKKREKYEAGFENFKLGVVGEEFHTISHFPISIRQPAKGNAMSLR